MWVILSLLLACSCAHWTHPLQKIKPENIVRAPNADIYMAVSPTVLPSSGQWVTLKISDVPSPSPTDWIGVYSPSTANITTSSPIKYMYAYKDPDYLSTGAATIQWYLVNERADVTFILFRNGTTHPVLAQQSNIVSFVNYNEPLQVRIALTGKQGEMRVTWTTNATNAPNVLFGTKSGTYDSKVAATSFTYTIDQMCGDPANSTGWRDPGKFHSAVLANLLPATTYYYVVNDSYGASAEYAFVTAPKVDPTTRFNFIVFGDLGQDEVDGSNEQSQDPPSRNTTSALAAELQDHHLVLHIGDISYARGYDSQWETFFDQISPLARQAPWMTCAGNHERDWPGSGSTYTGYDSGGECGVAYSTRFPMPNNNDWYSFDYGSAHFILMDTEMNFTAGSEQYNFIKNDLASVNRSVTPWLIFSGHRPMYCDSTNNSTDDNGAGDQPVAQQLQMYIEPLMMQYKVDLAFWGHHHSYQRSCPVNKETCVKSNTTGAYLAPVHILTGTGGAGNSQNILPTPPSWIQFLNDDTHGYTRCTVTSESIVLEYVIGGAGNTQVLDSFDLVRSKL